MSKNRELKIENVSRQQLEVWRGGSMTVSIEKSFFDNKKVFVDDSFADIIPWFLENRKEDLKKVRDLVQASDYQQIQRMGHRWKGTCASYGFEKLSRAGEALEELSIKKASDEMSELISNTEEYLGQLEIVYVSSAEEETFQAPADPEQSEGLHSPDSSPPNQPGSPQDDSRSS